MKKKDFISALVSGVLIGGCAVLITKSLENGSTYLADLALNGWQLVAILVACFGVVEVIVGVGSLIGRKIPTVYEATKFLIVGGLNTLVDFGVLNLLIMIFSTATGTAYTLFKATSFIIAVINSYYWNKIWTFSSSEKTNANKVLRFFTVSIIGFGINVIIASVIVNVLPTPTGLEPQVWANIGAVAATVASMIWNFVGYKFFVFHRKEGTFFVHADEKRKIM